MSCNHYGSVQCLCPSWKKRRPPQKTDSIICRNNMPSRTVFYENSAFVKSLDISSNNLKVIPSAIGLLINLETCIIRNNNISCFPNEFEKLTCLHTLDFSYNSFTELDPCLFELPCIKFLDMRHNSLSVLPSHIIQLKKLCVLLVDGNPWNPYYLELLRPIFLNSEKTLAELLGALFLFDSEEQMDPEHLQSMVPLLSDTPSTEAVIPTIKRRFSVIVDVCRRSFSVVRKKQPSSSSIDHVIARIKFQETYKSSICTVLSQLRDVYDLHHQLKPITRRKSDLRNIKDIKIRGFYKPKSFENETPKRKAIINELIDTEKKYVDEMNFFVEKYVRGAREKKLISATESSTLFNNFVTISNFHKDNFLPRLLESKETIGSAFLDSLPHMTTYVNFLFTYDKNLEMLKSIIIARKKLSRFMQSVSADPLHTQLDYKSYFLLPVQRITRYVMLLRTLLKATDRLHPDFANLRAALAAVETCADDINSCALERESRDEIVSVARRFSDAGALSTIVQPHRKFIRESSLRLVKAVYYVSSENTLKFFANDKKSTFVLFNDILIESQAISKLNFLGRKEITFDRGKEKNKLKLLRVFSLTSRQQPATFTHAGELRVVTDNVVLYLDGQRDELLNWLQDFNTRIK